jgi:hypothetical protein
VPAQNGIGSLSGSGTLNPTTIPAGAGNSR